MKPYWVIKGTKYGYMKGYWASVDPDTSWVRVKTAKAAGKFTSKKKAFEARNKVCDGECCVVLKVTPRA